MIKRLIWTIWTPMSSVLKKADKLNLSLSLISTVGIPILIRLNLYIGSGPWGVFKKWLRTFKSFITPQPLRAPGYCRTPSGRAAGQTSPVNTLTSIIFHGSFANLARTFTTLISRDKFDHGGSASLNMRIMDHLMSWPLLAFLNSFFKLESPNLVQR